MGVTGPASVPQPGPLLVALDLHLLTEACGAIAPERIFDRNSIAVAENSDGLALFATDFHTDPAGYVRVLVIDRGLGAERAGAQRIGPMGEKTNFLTGSKAELLHSCPPSRPGQM